MTTTTDLTPERLDELERKLDGYTETLVPQGWQWDAAAMRLTWNEVAALIAIAKRADGAERERDRWRAFARGTDVWEYDGGCACCHRIEAHAADCLWSIAAIAQPTDAGGA